VTQPPAQYLSEDALIGSEQAQLLAFVHDNRTEVVALLDGLSEEQARARLVPSATTLLGIVKHCAFVERVWFHVSLAGRSREELGLPDAAEDSWTLAEGDTIASVLADYRMAWAEADELAAPYHLDDLAVHNRRGPLTLRWVYVHMVEELARHAGHGDILREQVLAQG
jgi:ketopantoate reductase